MSSKAHKRQYRAALSLAQGDIQECISTAHTLRESEATWGVKRHVGDSTRPGYLTKRERKLQYEARLRSQQEIAEKYQAGHAQSPPVVADTSSKATPVPDQISAAPPGDGQKGTDSTTYTREPSSHRPTSPRSPRAADHPTSDALRVCQRQT